MQLTQVSENTFPIKPPTSWLQAFALLITYLKQKSTTEKQVVFFDELPWMATHKSGFLKGLSYFWNSWAVKHNIVVVICGSAASWMIQKVVNNKGGSLSRVLEELIHSGFITSYRPYGKKKKTKLYRLTDEYSMFYLKFMEGKEYEGKGIWNHLSQTQLYKSWSGYAFESLCLKHIPQIKKALNISGIYSLSSSFTYKGNKEKEGTQIDLLIDRKDGVINLFEVKFYNESFIINKGKCSRIWT